MEIDIIIKAANLFHKIITSSFDPDDNGGNIQELIDGQHQHLTDVSVDILMDTSKFVAIIKDYVSQSGKSYLEDTYELSESVEEIKKLTRYLSMHFYQIFYYSGLVGSDLAPNITPTQVGPFDGSHNMMKVPCEELMSCLQNIYHLTNAIVLDSNQIVSLIKTVIVDRTGTVDDCNLLRTLVHQGIEKMQTLLSNISLEGDFSEFISEFNRHWQVLLLNVQENPPEDPYKEMMDDAMEEEHRHDPEMIQAFKEGYYF